MKIEDAIFLSPLAASGNARTGNRMKTVKYTVVVSERHYSSGTVPVVIDSKL